MKSRKMVFGTLAVVVTLAIVGLFFLKNNPTLFRQNYSQIYSLVEDKVSLSAPIIINLPKGSKVDGAQQMVSFLPELKGQWVKTSLENAIAFKPASPLDAGKYYTVTYKSLSGEIKKDFMADEDPKIIDIFPRAGSEADESSAITISFNRPMVPLTTLGELEGTDIPVDILPKTEGKFKWISARNLQFIPTTHLVRSAHYTVKIRDGFVSMDGLAVSGKTHVFTTRPLSFEGATSDKIRYNQPVELRFNQPVDLGATIATLTLTNQSGNKKIPFSAVYGEKTVTDPTTRKPVKVQDTSVIRVYSKNDVLGRVNMWDVVTSYTVNVTRAYPLGGDIIYDRPISTLIKTTNILETVTAQSARTRLATPDLFDPEGTVTLSFYENIDLGKSKIEAKGLKSIAYAQACQKSVLNDYFYQASGNCVKVDDKTQLILSFDPKSFSSGEVVPIVFNKIVNSDGQQLNSESLANTVVLHVYPTLSIIKSIPENNGTGASVSTLTLCTNVPLQPATSADFHQIIKANEYLVFGRWDESYLQTSNYYNSNPPCRDGEFVTYIHYGLHPGTSYELDLNPKDVFGQSVTKHISFKTETSPKFYMRFSNLQKIYNVTTPDKTNFTYATENFDQVDVNICKTSGLEMVRYLENRPENTTPGSNLKCLESKTGTIDLPDTLWVNNYFQFDLKKYYPDPRGQYIISFSHPKYKNGQGQQIYDRTYVSVTNLAVGSKEINWTKYDILPANTERTVDTSGRGNLYWVNQISTLQPTVGATVAVVHNTGFYNEVPQIAKTATTNDTGVAELPLIQDVIGAVVTSGDDTAIVSDWADTLNRADSASTFNKVYMYTDRPIYRPGQEVNIKGLYRIHFDGKYEINKDENVDLKISNAKGEVILDQKVAVNKYGTFATKITLPQNAPLGTYNMSVLNQYSFFEVQEYVGAAFETVTSLDKEEYKAGETANISVNAKYYFGVPLDGGTLEYTLTAQNYYFDRYSDEYFNFGGDWYNCYDCGYGDTFIKRDQISLDDQGKAILNQKLDFDLMFKEGDRDQSKIVVLHGTIKDKQGKSVSFQQSFIVHRADFYAGIKTDPSFTAQNQSFNVRIKTVDVKGKPIGHSGLTVDVQKVEWKSFKRQEVDGGFYNRYERVKTPVLTKNIGTDGAGNATLPLTLASAGEYEITVTGKDGAGNVVTSVTSQYVYGQGSVDVRQTNNATLDMTALNKDLKSGGNGSIIIQSPFKHAKALIAIERGRILDYKVVDIDQSIYNYTFKVIDDYIPNIYVSALLLSPDPQVKFGQVQFNVNRENKKLTIDVKSNKTSYLPGEKVTLNITTTDVSGKRVPAEISLAVADLSVLALTGNQKKDPLTFFYDGFPLTVTTGTNIKNILSEVPIPTGTKGGGGGAAGDLSTRKRGEFKDTAFWQAQVETNEQGTASVTFTLPDNLTRWQVETLGITEDTKLGVRYDEITSQKDVMVVPIKPRFIVPGDEFSIGAKIFNQTKETQTLDVSLSSGTLVLANQGSQKKIIKAGETTTVYFDVTAPLEKIEGSHTFVLSAKNNNYNDTVENTMPIKQNTTYEAVATANSTTADSAKEYVYIPDSVLADQGGLTIKTSATLAIYLSDALKNLIQFPDGSSYGLASELSSLSIIKKGLAVKNVGENFNLPPIVFDGATYTLNEAIGTGLNKLYDLQTSNGGFSYYKGLKPSLGLSTHVLNALIDMKEAGIAVRSDVVANVGGYIVTAITKPEIGTSIVNDTDTLIVATYALRRADVGGVSGIENIFLPRLTTSTLNEKLSSNSLAYLALLSIKGNYNSTLRQQIMTALENRIEIDSRGAYIRSNSNNLSWQYFETPVKTTALFLKALVAGKNDFSETANIMRWLLASRSKDGAWGGTNSTLAVIDAFADYLNWKKETESDFSLNIKLDGTKIQTFDFNKNTVLSLMQKFLPISTFERNKIQSLSFERTNRTTLKNNFYYDIGLKYYLPAEQIAPRDEGIAIERNFYSLLDPNEENPISSAKVGDVIKGKLTIISPKDRNLFTVEDAIPAGFELINFNLATEDATNITKTNNTTLGVISAPELTLPIRKQSLLASLWGYFSAAPKVYDQTADAKISFKNPLPVEVEELHDDSLRLFTQQLPAGEYTYTYYIRATVPGAFRHLPAIASELNSPENFGRTGGSLFTVTQ